MNQEKLNKDTTAAPILSTRTKKIGATTFIVSAKFNNQRKRDIVSIISRLIDSELSA